MKLNNLALEYFIFQITNIYWTESLLGTQDPWVLIIFVKHERHHLFSCVTKIKSKSFLIIIFVRNNIFSPMYCSLRNIKSSIFIPSVIIFIDTFGDGTYCIIKIPPRVVDSNRIISCRYHYFVSILSAKIHMYINLVRNWWWMYYCKHLIST